MGWVRSNLQRVRRMRSRLGKDEVTLVLEDGSLERFTVDDFYQNMYQNAQRLRALHEGGEDVPGPDRFGAALLSARDLPPELVGPADAQRRLERQIEAHLAS